MSPRLSPSGRNLLMRCAIFHLVRRYFYDRTGNNACCRLLVYAVPLGSLFLSARLFSLLWLFRSGLAVRSRVCPVTLFPPRFSAQTVLRYPCTGLAYRLCPLRWRLPAWHCRWGRCPREIPPVFALLLGVWRGVVPFLLGCRGILFLWDCPPVKGKEFPSLLPEKSGFVSRRLLGFGVFPHHRPLWYRMPERLFRGFLWVRMLVPLRPLHFPKPER